MNAARLPELRPGDVVIMDNLSSHKRADGFDALAHGRAFVAGQVVHDDDVAGPQFGHQDLRHIGLEPVAVDRSVEHHRRNHAGHAQPSDQRGRLAVAMRESHPQAFAPGAAAMAAGHVGRGPRLIDEDQAFRLQIELAVEPAPPLAQDVGTVLLDRVPGLYGMARPFSPASDMMLVLEEERSGPMSIVILGVDLGKNACSVVGVDSAGAVVVRRSMRRQTLVDYVAKLPACVVAMEACCGAHNLGRLFAAHGHEIRLMSPEYVRPYVKAQKNDDRDAEGIAEAASRPTMRFVELKTQEQLDIQTLHRVRSRLVAERRSLINQLRAILLERGTIFPVGRRKLELGIDALLADEDTTLSPRLRQLVGELRAEWRELDTRVEALNGEFVELARNDAAARRLTSIPGVGVLNATALIAAVGDASSFAKARDLGAWLGLVPRQHTTGGKPRLLGISKRGNTYLRTLLIHGARAALPSLARSETPLGRWLTGMIERGVHRNAIVVALANKLARIAWAALRKDATFERGYPVAV